MTYGISNPFSMQHVLNGFSFGRSYRVQLRGGRELGRRRSGWRREWRIDLRDARRVGGAAESVCAISESVSPVRTVNLVAVRTDEIAPAEQSANRP